MKWTDGARTDALPRDPSGPYVIQGARDAQLWVVNHPWVFKVGHGQGIPNDDAATNAVGPWFYVAVPLPTDLVLGQANHAEPTARRWAGDDGATPLGTASGVNGHGT